MAEALGFGPLDLRVKQSKHAGHVAATQRRVEVWTAFNGFMMFAPAIVNS